MSNSPLDNAILTFYSTLERIMERYEELTDTDVRESIHITLTHFFIWGRMSDHLPKSYGMFSHSGDEEVANAIRTFLESMAGCKEVAEIPTGMARLTKLQNASLNTPDGRQYDEFIGHADEPLVFDRLPSILYESDYTE